MKISDFAFRFPTCGLTRRDAICRARLFLVPNNKIAVLLTDVGSKNTGSSVTNSVETIYQTLLKRGHITDNAIVIEHYDDSTCNGATCDLVTFDVDFTPNWKKIAIQEAAKILQCDEKELTSKTSENVNFMREVDRIRLEIDPQIDNPILESPAILKRRALIEEGMIVKNDLLNLVQSGSTEQTIQKLIDSDLSIIAEIYAKPEEEYIVFSQFPLNNGFVDYAIFSGRSRMDITLIEIKGADFNFANQTGYENISQKINEAAQQLRGRIGYTHRNYEIFRENAHKTRANAENGSSTRSHLIGPITPLQVDPNKDVNIYGVVIGGRCIDDLYESKIRHEYETQSTPKVRVESWDSWTRKVRRK